MLYRRPVLTCLITLVALAGSASAAQACSNSWTNPSGGSWSTAADWSTGVVPTTTDDVCIVLPGTYTVTLGASGASVNSLTLGGPSGTQTLDVAGQDYNYGGETYNSTTLALTAASTINTGGVLILDATSGGAPVSGGNAMGGSAVLDTAALTNAGQIVSRSEDSTWQDYYEGTLTNQASGSIDVNSGRLTMPSPNTGGVTPSYTYSVTNNGSVAIASGASLVLAAGLGHAGGFINNGPVTNGGSIAAINQGGQMTWTQSGGSVSGNDVVMQNGAALVDSVGSGSFRFNDASGALSGTIPAGQTVTVQGALYNYGGENYNSTTLALNANGSTAPVTNNGTVVLDAPGSGTTSGGNTYLTSGTLDNNGMLVTQVEDSNWKNNLQANVTNETTGNIDVKSGALVSNGSVTATNNGTATVAPGAQWSLNEGATLVNAASGTIVPQIASATSLGSFQVTSPCCNGAGSITAGGTLAPALVGGFTPATNEEFQVVHLDGGAFSGKFGSVGSGFTADYANEAATPAFVGVVYGTTVIPPVPIRSVLSVGTIRAAGRRLSVALRCSAGTGVCAAARILGTVTEHFRGAKLTAVTAQRRRTAKKKTKRVAVAADTVRLASGTRTTASIALNRTGRALLSRYRKLPIVITVQVGGKTVKSSAVVLRAPARTKRKHL